MNLGGMNGAGFIGGYNQIIYQMVGQPVGVFYCLNAMDWLIMALVIILIMFKI